MMNVNCIYLCDNRMSCAHKNIKKWFFGLIKKSCVVFVDQNSNCELRREIEAMMPPPPPPPRGINIIYRESGERT
jgi:hypothetical protein